MTLAPGVVVGGDFRVDARLGEGGMGEVWSAEQLSVGRRRAVKVMRRELADDAGLRERFIREARIGATIESDHVVEVVAAGVDADLRVPWIAMELLEGESLEATIARRGPLPWAEVAIVADHLGHALRAAHAAGVIHRDLKPENVFLARPRRSGAGVFEVKVLDFGIAKLIEGAEAASGQSLVVGTPLYMAPEQTDTSGVSSPATDVWALGLIFYRALTGSRYWRAGRDGEMTITSVLRQVLVDPLPPASQRAAEDGVTALLPPGFDEWFLHCVARAPEARFPDAGGACSVLVALLASEAPSRPAGVSVRAPSLSELAETHPNVPSERAPPREPPAVEVTRLHDSADFSEGRVGSVLVVRWWRPLTPEAMEAMGRVTGRALASEPGHVFVLPIVDSSAKRPAPGVTEAFDRVMQSHEERVDGVAIVVLGTGFQSALIRSLLTGVTFARRPRHPVKVCGSIADAIASFGEVPRASEVAAAIERFAEAVPESAGASGPRYSGPP
jgi:serine/threonine protein kinase